MKKEKALLLQEIIQIDPSIKNDKKFKNIVIEGLTCDSRQVAKNYLFAAFKGSISDGTKYINSAIEKGAVIILTDKSTEHDQNENICFIKHDNPRKLFALIASKFYSNMPENIVAVTGTNGKTSTVSFCKQIWSKLHKNCATIGTLGVQDSLGVFENDALSGSLTTPETVDLRQKLEKLSSNHINNVAIEASSHGLDQFRVDGLNLKAAAFSNFTQDHLDYHKDLDSYFKAKARLFSEILPDGSVAILNSDCEKFEEIYNICKAKNHTIHTIGKAGNNNDNFVNITNIDKDGLLLKFAFNIKNKEYKVDTNLVGDFHIYNILMAVLLVHSTGIEIEPIIDTIKNISNIEGRMQKIDDIQKDRDIFVDFAHTPDALEKTLQVLNKSKKGKLILVFGCGGDRDKSKRPVMGKIANDNADIIIVTDDNPRFEDAGNIRSEIISKIPDAIEIDDREKAIKYAISILKSDDILLVAGKGHEAYQDIKGVKTYFSDKEVIVSFL